MLFRQRKPFDLMSTLQQHVFKTAEKITAKLQNHVALHSGTLYLSLMFCDSLKKNNKVASWPY